MEREWSGVAKVNRKENGKGGDRFVWYEIELNDEDGGTIEMTGMYRPFDDDEYMMRRKAEVIAEAFNVWCQTGMTPKQLVEKCVLGKEGK